MIIIKEFYIFNIRKEFAKLYKDKPSDLFFIFNRIYYMKEIDKDYGYNLFEQISNWCNKEEINKFIERRYKDKIMYSKGKDEHIINNLFKNEISILKVKPSNIKIESNVESPVFLKDLKDLPYNLFVCNFKEQEYFFIKKTRVAVKNN